MKAEIHPEYAEVAATCSCGNVIQTRSTLCKDFHLEVCSNCHPFYTGRQKVMDTGGRVERFRRRFGARTTINKAGDKAEDQAEDKAEDKAEENAG